MESYSSGEENSGYLAAIRISKKRTIKVSEMTILSGSESLTLKIDVCIWLYALLVTHASNDDDDCVWLIWLTGLLVVGLNSILSAGIRAENEGISGEEANSKAGCSWKIDCGRSRITRPV